MNKDKWHGVWTDVLARQAHRVFVLERMKDRYKAGTAVFNSLQSAYDNAVLEMEICATGYQMEVEKDVDL